MMKKTIEELNVKGHTNDGIFYGLVCVYSNVLLRLGKKPLLELIESLKNFNIELADISNNDEESQV